MCFWTCGDQVSRNATIITLERSELQTFSSPGQRNILRPEPVQPGFVRPPDSSVPFSHQEQTASDRRPGFDHPFFGLDTICPVAAGSCSPAVPSSVQERSNAFAPVIFISQRSLACEPTIDTRQSPARSLRACSVMATTSARASGLPGIVYLHRNRHVAKSTPVFRVETVPMKPGAWCSGNESCPG